jgi:hypothetical protein
MYKFTLFSQNLRHAKKKPGYTVVWLRLRIIRTRILHLSHACILLRAQSSCEIVALQENVIDRPSVNKIFPESYSFAAKLNHAKQCVAHHKFSFHRFVFLPIENMVFFSEEPTLLKVTCSAVQLCQCSS